MVNRYVIVFMLLGFVFLQGCGNIIINKPKEDFSTAGNVVRVPVEIEITKSVHDRIFTVIGGSEAIHITNFHSETKPGTTSTEILKSEIVLTLIPGNYTLIASGTYKQWNGVDKSITRKSSFAVTKLAPTPTVSMTISPPLDEILIPRGGTSQPLSFNLNRANSTAAITVNATALPNGVTFPQVSAPASSTTSVTIQESLKASATANGKLNATFSASMTGAKNANVNRIVRVLPKPGAIAWLSAPFLTTSGPPPVISPDGLFSVTASRVGASRVWTLRIAPTTPGSGSPLDVTTASWGGPGGSNLAGIAFCGFSPTMSAMVLSDDNEGDVSTHQPGVTYRLKVIRLDGGTPQLAGSLEGLKFLNGVQPRLGFSQDCSIVGAWSIDVLTSSTRNVQFSNIFTNDRGAYWSYSDNATIPSTSLATINGTNIQFNGPQGQSANLPVP